MYTRYMIYLGLVLLSTSAHAATGDTGFKVPFQYGLGKNLFEKNCSLCHGTRGKGSEVGPPLMHQFYIPSHHDDSAFYRAALTGTRAHHWKFGDMKPVPGISRKDMDNIIPYLRWLQQKHGFQ